MVDLKISVDEDTQPKKPEIKELVHEASEAERIERENEKLRERIRKAQEEQDNLKARLSIGGRSLAGQPNPVEKTPQEKAEEEAAEILRGRL